MQYREWKARATAALARAYKVWPPRIPEHVWRDAYISGNSPEEGATAAEVYDRNSRPVKLKSSAISDLCRIGGRSHLAGSPGTGGIE